MVLEAKGIKGKDWFGKSDPFLMLYIRPKEDKIKRTSTKSNTTNAVWNEAFDLEVSQRCRCTFKVMPCLLASVRGRMFEFVAQCLVCKLADIWTWCDVKDCFL